MGDRWYGPSKRPCKRPAYLGFMPVHTTWTLLQWDDHPPLGPATATKSRTDASTSNLVVLAAFFIDAITENDATGGLNNNHAVGVASTYSDSVSIVHTDIAVSTNISVNAIAAPDNIAALPITRFNNITSQHNISCKACGIGDDILPCSKCNLVFHLGCLWPPLDNAPEGICNCPYFKSGDSNFLEQAHRCISTARGDEFCFSQDILNRRAIWYFSIMGMVVLIII